jgi:hypothetical protein
MRFCLILPDNTPYKGNDFSYTKNSCNIKSKMLYYKWVMKDAKIQTNQNKIE